MLAAALLVSLILGVLIATRSKVWALAPAGLFVVGLTVAIGIASKWAGFWMMLAAFINVVGLDMAYLSSSLIFRRTSDVRTIQLAQTRNAMLRKSYHHLGGLSVARPTLFAEIRAGARSARGAYRGKGK